MKQTEIRKEQKITATKIANILGIDRKTLYKYESNPQSMPSGIAIKMAKLYGVSIFEILEIEPESSFLFSEEAETLLKLKPLIERLNKIK
ncbi:MAG: helix-turn-helix transcriptional regulator [Bacilli bacterium]|nr:helix-turn-helix transcriptional regulator [Bacilli bacterium]